MQRNTQTGFTLIELMMVIMIIGVLAAIAYPNYQNSLIKSRRADAKSALLELSVAMERLYTARGCYNPGADKDCTPPNADASNPTARDPDRLLPFDVAPKTAYQYGVAAASVKANYDIVACTPGSAVSPCSTLTIPADGFVLAATPRSNVPDKVCDRLTLDSTGAKTENGTGTVADCW